MNCDLLVQFGMVWYGWVYFGLCMVLYGCVWFGMLVYGLVCLCMVWNACECLTGWIVPSSWLGGKIPGTRLLISWRGSSETSSTVFWTTDGSATDGFFTPQKPPEVQIYLPGKKYLNQAWRGPRARHHNCAVFLSHSLK